MPETAVKVSEVSMCFNLNREKINTLKEHVIMRLKRKIQVDEFYALQNVSFQVARGESFAVMGNNGSGKSTLLKLIAKVYKPTSGSVTVRGVVAPMIELGAGFDSELTAGENIFLNGAVLGYNRDFMRRQYDEILDYAEVRDFEHVPIKNFSSGMRARLGFAIATIIKPDILIVDEVLSVGDAGFRKKCEERINQLLEGGTTLLLVSHAQESVLKMCSRALWLDKGTVRAIGDVRTVCEQYQNSSSAKPQPKKPQPRLQPGK